MPVQIHIRDRIAEIVFDHPPDNAFDSVIWNSLSEITIGAGRNPDANVVVVRAEGRGFCGGAATYRPPKPIASALSRSWSRRTGRPRKRPTSARSWSQSPARAGAREGGAQRARAAQLDRSCRCEQRFTLDMYMHEDSQKARDAFVAEGKAAKF